MSDEGKVMIGTDGKPLLSPDGSIVLADDLYPWHPSQSHRWFNRQASTLSALWILDWTLFDANTHPSVAAWFYPSWPVFMQHVCRWTFGDDIEWPRVEKLTANIPTSRTIKGAETAVARISKALDTETPPAGRGVRDDWTSVGTPSKGLTSYTIDWVIDGVKPSYVSLAFLYDDETVPVGTDKDGLYLGSFAWKAVYNLAS
jgi:hypothetical protein